MQYRYVKQTYFLCLSLNFYPAGMQLMKLTGGRLVATLHRVNTMKIDKDRSVEFASPFVSI